MEEEILCNCDLTIIKIHPFSQPDAKERLDKILAEEHMQEIIPINAAFYHDVVLRALLAVK